MPGPPQVDGRSIRFHTDRDPGPAECGPAAVSRGPPRRIDCRSAPRAATNLGECWWPRDPVPVGRRCAGRRILWATHKQERAPPMIFPGGLAAPSVLPQMRRATGDKRCAGSLVGPGRCPLYVRAQLDTVGLSWTPWDLVWLKATARETGKIQLTGYFRWWWQVLGSNQRRPPMAFVCQAAYSSRCCQAVASS